MKPLFKDYSFGIIPLRKENGHWQTFVVQQTNGHWSFPKGHAEHAESAHETAQRELFEETGLKVVSYFPVESLSAIYICHNKFSNEFEKKVTLFCASVEGTISLCPIEILRGTWIDVCDVNQLIVFESMQSVLRELQVIVKAL